MSEDDKNWKWIVGREQTMQTPLNQFVEKENTVYHTLIKGSETVVFYNDKQSMAEVGRYYMSARDERHSRIGSIFGVQLMFSNNAELFVEGVMVVSTYGKKFVPSNDINKINQLKRLVIDDLLPSYQRMLETEMGMLYLRHYRADRMAFRVLLCMDGCGTISYDEGTVNFYKGDCVFVPADSEVLTIHGQAQFLDIRG